MSDTDLVLEVNRREGTGKNVSRRVRAAGNVPAVVYGGGIDPISIEVDRRRLVELMKDAGGLNAVFLLKLAGGKNTRHTMIKQLDVDPLDRSLVHVDFQRIDMTETVRVNVAVELVGTAEGVKTEGGILDFITREVEVECLPGNIPTSLQIDVSELNIGDTLEASALSPPEGVTLIDDSSRTLVSISAARVEEEVEEEAEGLLEAEMAEPELVGRDKADEETEED